MRRYVTILWIFCLVLVVLERFSAATIRLVGSGFAGEAVRWLACQAVAAIPEALFLLGLWWIRDALADVARGELFAASMTRMLERVGIALAAGAVLRIFAVPGLWRLLGFDQGHLIAFDSAALALGAIGLALQAIAGVVRHVAAVQSELDEIF